MKFAATLSVSFTHESGYLASFSNRQYILSENEDMLYGTLAKISKEVYMGILQYNFY